MELLQNKNDYRKSLSFVSWDKDNQVSLIEKEDKVYDFDGITRYLCEQFYSKQILASCDAFLQRGDEYYLIEFKNQEAQKIKPKELEKKAFMSFNLLRLELDQMVSVEDARQHATLLVVFRDGAPPAASPEGEAAGAGSYKAVMDKLGELAKIEDDPILFGLRKMQGKFYRRIYTIPKSEFMNKWYPQLFPGT